MKPVKSRSTSTRLGRVISRRENLKSDLDVALRIILNWILRKHICSVWTDSSGSGQGLLAGSCEHGNEFLGFIKGVGMS
jgi:hypothetical protein